MKTTRRCKECDEFRSWIDDVKFCPEHGKPVEDMPAPVCKCGRVKKQCNTYCTNCGAPTEV